MVLILKKGESKEKFQKFLENKTRHKGFDGHAFLGKIKLKQNPVAIQKKMRDEW